MKCAFLFPGQGSQYVGMGKALAEAFPIAREVYEALDETLKQPLSKIMMEGPVEALTLTQNTQPALMTHSMAVIRVLEKEFNIDANHLVSMAAGHSLGEYSALCAANVFDFVTTVNLLRTRGSAMQNAVPVGQGAMAALIGVTIGQVQDLCKQATQGNSVAVVANDNGASQVVVSGHMDAIERIIAIAKEAGIRRVVKLPVSAPFHSPLMEPAAREMRDALAKTNPKPFNFPVIANITACPYENSSSFVRDSLVRQITGSVRWAETMRYMIDQEVDFFVEVGAGKVLSKIMQRTARDSKVCSVDTPADLEEFAKILSAF